MDFLTPYINAEIVAFCLLFGNVLKNNLGFVNNRFIPFILGLIGVLLNIGFKNDVDFLIVLSGFVSGLLSTSLHQGYKNLMSNDDKIPNK
ncbi:phage holin family protein [Gemella sp. zg-1178]|uniref:phage holin family protein n=1 Tax=Gemella sp. zg-1178 TaxID=2840372 RepID=UPI001C0457E5|nr:phage holin family protein [Gemella sp. zg-1178]MBU0279224.1 phage holin family protein [Gemella sp. zg-1178]